MPRTKHKKFVATVEFEIPNDKFHRDIYEDESFCNELLNQLVKVKSGLYDNRFYGNIVEIKEAK